MGFIAGNPKELARNIAEGYVILSVVSLRKYSNNDIRDLYRNLMIVQREIRQEQYEIDDIDNIKKKHMRLQRLFRGVTTITTYAKPRKIPL